MSVLNSLKNIISNKKALAVAGVTSFASAGSFAADGGTVTMTHGDYSAQINAAVAVAQTNMAAVALGLLALAAVTFGLGKLLGWFGH